MNHKALSSTGASLAAGTAGAALVELAKELLAAQLSWQQVVTIGIIAVALVAGAAILNHKRYSA